MHIKNEDFWRKQDLFHPLTSATVVHKATSLRTVFFCTFCSSTSRHFCSPSGAESRKESLIPEKHTGQAGQQHPQYNSTVGRILESSHEERNPKTLAVRYSDKSPKSQSGFCPVSWPEKQSVTCCCHENDFSLRCLFCLVFFLIQAEKVPALCD